MSFEMETAEDLLAALRKGNAQKLEIGLGELKVPCRLISAGEEAKIIVRASSQAKKTNPGGERQDVFEAQETMREMLKAATTIDSVPGLPERFFGMLTSQELVALYDEYVTINSMINPAFADLTKEQIAEIVSDVKKKKKGSKDFYTYQLAGLGKFFLEVVVPNLRMDNELTSQ